MANPLERKVIRPTLIGRARHWEVIGQLIIEVQRGRGQTLVIIALPATTNQTPDHFSSHVSSPISQRLLLAFLP